MPNCLPVAGLPQSWGTPTLPQSYVMLAGGLPTAALATSGQGCQLTGPAAGVAGLLAGLVAGTEAAGEPAAPDVGELQRVVRPAQPDPGSATAASTTSAVRRPTADPLPVRVSRSEPTSGSPPGSDPTGEHLGHVDPYRPLELFVGARAGIPVRPPAPELGGVAEPVALHRV